MAPGARMRRFEVRNATGRGAAALLVALVGLAATAFAGSPAHAYEAADLRLQLQTGSISLKAGGQPETLTFTVVNDGPSAVSTPIANVQVPFGDRGVHPVSSNPACQAVNGPNVLACPLPGLAPGQSATVTIVIAPPAAGSVAPGETLNQPGAVSVYNPAGGDFNNGNDSGQFGVALAGGAGAVTQVSGTVADSFTGQGVPGAAVLVTDSAGATCRTTTQASGAYVCAATAAAPLTAGKVTIRVTRAGYQPAVTEVDAQGPLNGVQLALNPLTTVSPTPSASAPPILVDRQADVVAADSGSGATVLIVVLGSLLVLAALGGAGWWLYKSQQAGSHGDPLDYPGGGAAPFLEAPTQRLEVNSAALGGAAATQVVGRGGYGDSQPTTVIGRREQGDPQPTTVIGRGAYSEAQPTTALGVPAAPSRYGDEPAYDVGGYGGPTGYGRADDTAFYGASGRNEPLNGTSGYGMAPGPDWT
ncbi:MAG TPA: carboxypeptidase regulatory-like domain-containing protein, partial [Cryptosporangiaceae bacterium]|nr:carboxypeptidase regulatory-like domain-containing protein [Cryptosporangiaceae bacterium]